MEWRGRDVGVVQAVLPAPKPRAASSSKMAPAFTLYCFLCSPCTSTAAGLPGKGGTAGREAHGVLVS